MARKIKFLTEDERHQLVGLEQQIYPGLVKYVEKNGVLPPDFEKVATEKHGQGVYTKSIESIKNIVAKLNSKESYEKFIKDTADEGGLTTEELKDRLEAFQALPGFGTAEKNDKIGFYNQIRDYIVQRIKEGGPEGSGLPDLMKKTSIGSDLGARIVAGQNDSEQEIAEEIYNRINTVAPGAGEEVFNEMKKLSVDVKGMFQKDSAIWKKFFQPAVPGQDVSVDTKRLQDAIAAATTKEEKDAAINAYISSLSGQLESSREDFISGEEERALSALERQVPITLQNLNVRGMLQSGEREDELTTKALSLGSSLEEIQSDLEAEDNQFYFDAAYQNALRKELSTTADYRSAIQSERGKISTEQSRRFRSSQSDLDRQLEEELTRSSYGRSIALQRKKMQKERQQQQDQNRLAIVSKIGETGANVATNVVLNKVG